jgi:septum formation protein
MTCVAGGLKLTHPSVQPFVKELVSNSSVICTCRTNVDSVPYISGAVALAQVGTVDSVRGLPRELTEKLIRESLQGK